LTGVVIELFRSAANRTRRTLVLTVRDPSASWLAARMFAWRAILPVLERVMPLPTLIRLMTARPDRRSDRDIRAQRVVDLAERVFGVRGSDQNCLERSIVTYRYLSKLGADPQLVIAIRKGTTPARGHAWVTMNEMPVHDSPAALHDFESLVSFCAGSPTNSTDSGEISAA